MQRFHYQGRDNLGNLVEGNREGVSAEGVGAQLVSEGIIPIQITALKDSGGLWKKLKAYDPVTTEDLLIFCQQMAALLQAGIPLLMSLRRVCDTSKNQRFKNTLEIIIQRISEGKVFSAA